MAGFREFQTGEVLTAANVDDYLAKQAVMKFADSAARDTALGTAVGGGNALREGMVAWLDSSDELQAYDGTSWSSVGGLPLGTATPTDGQILAYGTATSTWNPTDGGKLVAVKHALFTGTQTNSTATGANFAVTDLSITHTLADASNKLIISAYLGVAGSTFQRGNVGIAVADGGTLIAVGTSPGNRTPVGAGGSTSATANAANVTMPSVYFVYEPGDTASHTYTVEAINPIVSTQTIYINRSEIDSNTGDFSRGSSGFVIQEVKV